jgi:putative transposase
VRLFSGSAAERRRHGDRGGSAALQQLHCWYSRRHNRRHGRSAHLFRAHFFARELRSDADLLVACRYVAHNPVAAGLCSDPFSWPWSSTAASAGLDEPAIPLDAGPLRAALDDSPDWHRRYREFIEAGAYGTVPGTAESDRIDATTAKTTAVTGTAR